jgi:hypothetical protein
MRNTRREAIVDDDGHETSGRETLPDEGIFGLVATHQLVAVV